MSQSRFGGQAALFVLTFVAAVSADEGMWPYNRLPLQALKQKYQFEPSPEWLNRLQRASVRFNSGGSGSFVSSRGLVLTNHHVGADALQKLSTAERNLLKDGFQARKHSDELPCVDLELNVLVDMTDVTEQVQAAAAGQANPAQAQKARQAMINTLETESLKKTGLRSDVVTLYHGGQYHLYRYKKYTDVRLVFAPEQAIAFFGGDPDNFEYPRFDLDICFFRAYENGEPARTEHFLPWSPAGAADEELVFVSGHPGRTSRLNTVAHLEYLRDDVLPATLNLLHRREVLLSVYSRRSLENQRRAADELFGVQNGRKARTGALAGLQDPAVLDDKREAERKLREFVDADPELKKTTGNAWDEIETSLDVARRIGVEHGLLERGQAFQSQLFGIARRLVRMADEDQKPNETRLREYSSSSRESFLQQLYSTAPIYSDLEIVELGDSLAYLLEQRGPKDPLVQSVLAGRSPRVRAAELVRGSELADVARRRELAAAGRAGIEASRDPMIELARLVDGRARDLRRSYEQQVEEPQRQAYGRIAAARFRLLGDSTYPDATFTLRLAIGTVRGYRSERQSIPPWTTMGGTFAHADAHANQPPFEIPASWHVAKERLDASTPFNFVSTNDIIGGNSGSPVVNRRGELVGLIFDGNLDSLVWDYVFTEETGRAVSVTSQSIREALKSIYGATELLEELGR